MRIGLMIGWLLMAMASHAQLYQTQSGTIQVSGIYKGADVEAVSNRLVMHLNYDRAEMHLRLAIPTLTTGNDSLNELLQKLRGQELVFNGKMNIAFVQTKSHPKQKFTTQGTLFSNGVAKPFSFSATLEHFPRGNTICILSGNFIVRLKQFNIDNLLPEEEKVSVKFNQSVLKKSGELQELQQDILPAG